MPRRTPPLVSVVIPTYNRVEHLNELLRSLSASTYVNFEVIIVDDRSDVPLDQAALQAAFAATTSVRVFRNTVNSGVAASRNHGAELAKGAYIFFIDDDNVIERHCMERLVKAIERDDGVGMVGPVTYYKKDGTIWWAGTRRNMTTSRTRIVGSDQSLPAEETWETDDFPNSWLLRSSIFREGYTFDPSYVIHYEEGDFAYKVKQALGYKLLVVKEAKMYHDIDPDDPADTARRWADTKRVYYTARNRLVFHRRYSKPSEFLLFFIIFNPLFTAYYLLFIWRARLGGKLRNFRSMLAYLQGVMAGMYFVIVGNRHYGN